MRSPSDNQPPSVRRSHPKPPWSAHPGGLRLDASVMSIEPYRIDPDDPRAPSQQVWDRLTPKERARILEELPSEFPVSEAMPPEGDSALRCEGADCLSLGGFFSRMGRKVYLGCELPGYYPGERMFAPDVIAVMDVEPHQRMHWVVSAEGKGLDSGHRDSRRGRPAQGPGAQRGALRPARHSRVLSLRPWAVEARWMAAGGREAPLPGPRATAGLLHVRGIGAGVTARGERLRFHHSGAPVLEADEMIASLERNARDSEVQRSEPE